LRDGLGIEQGTRGFELLAGDTDGKLGVDARFGIVKMIGAEARDTGGFEQGADNHVLLLTIADAELFPVNVGSVDGARGRAGNGIAGGCNAPVASGRLRIPEGIVHVSDYFIVHLRVTLIL
jgi:hypothetical protein